MLQHPLVLTTVNTMSALVIAVNPITAHWQHNRVIAGTVAAALYSKIIQQVGNFNVNHMCNQGHSFREHITHEAWRRELNSFSA